jgi:hypothetical protein
LPEISEVNAAFERDYDQARYEKKIAKIVRQLRARDGRETTDDCEFWNEAIKVLSEGDHYLLVMIRGAGAVGRPHGDLLKLIASALAICAVLLAAVYFFSVVSDNA